MPLHATIENTSLRNKHTSFLQWRSNSTNSCHVWWWRCRQCCGMQRPLWITIYKTMHSLYSSCRLHSSVSTDFPSSPLSIYFLIFSLFYFSLSFIGFTYFLLLSIPSLSTRIVPLRFQARGRRRRPNLGLVRVLFCTLCYLYSLVWCTVVLCSIWFSVLCVPSVLWHCWLGHLTRKNPSPYDL